ncbi:MAG: acetyl-CoA carboxylase biotin carboxyl carrier protein [Clostridia bacterium]|nr:acetyl-CoA carboxylase biotin carboxyl carrier protein [Clostridia bacterium]
MEYEKIKQLMEDMGNSKLTSIDIDFPDGTKISMKKEEQQIVKTVEKVVDTSYSNLQENKVESLNINEDNLPKAPDGDVVKSPMVGTFYLKPSPTSKPYVEVGQRVKKGDVLCIIEAMKLMNEIESEFDGEVKEILVKDEEAVEYGKPLFVIK